MIALLLLLASLASAQEVSTGTANLLDEVRISNLGKDTRDLLSGRYRQTGKPTFANGFCFADGTCQTTTPPAAGETLHISSAPPFTSSFSPTTAHTAEVCVSSVPFVLAEAARVRVFYNGPQGSNAVTFVGSTFMLDGAFTTGLSATTYLANFISNSATEARPASWSRYVDMTAGAHTVCIAPMSDTGNVRTCIGSGSTGVTTCEFGVEWFE